MKYLARAVNRPSAAVVPALRTSSPLAELDQRLHLDGFAQEFGSPFAGWPHQRAEQQGDVEEASELEAVPAPAVRKPSPPVLAPLPASTPPRGVHTEPRAVSTAVVAHRTAPTRRVSPTQPAPLTEPPPLTEQAPRRPEAQASTRADDAAPARAIQAAYVRAPDVETSAPEDRTAATNATRAELLAAGPARVAQAFTDLAAWLERPPLPQRDRVEAQELPREGLGRPPHPRPAPVPPQPHEVISVRSAPTAPVHRLEIGNIDVEVVLPERRMPVASAPAPSRSSTSFSGLPFGWRQR